MPDLYRVGAPGVRKRRHDEPWEIVSLCTKPPSAAYALVGPWGRPLREHFVTTMRKRASLECSPAHRARRLQTPPARHGNALRRGTPHELLSHLHACRRVTALLDRAVRRTIAPQSRYSRAAATLGTSHRGGSRGVHAGKQSSLLARSSSRAAMKDPGPTRGGGAGPQVSLPRYPTFVERHAPTDGVPDASAHATTRRR